jgi:hypothetical protein
MPYGDTRYLCVVFIKCYQGSVINHRLRYETFSPLWSFIVRIKRKKKKEQSDARTKLTERTNTYGSPATLHMSTQHTDTEGTDIR